MDMSGTEGVYHHEPLATTAQRIRDAVHQATQLNISIGGGTNKLIAKLAVDRAKPRIDSGGTGIHIVEPGTEEEFLRTFTLAEIPLVGPTFQARLAARGLITVQDILRHDLETLRGWMSDREAHWLWNRVRGVDDATVTHRESARSISRDETFPRDFAADGDIERELLALVTRAAADLRSDGLTARTVAVRLRDWDFRTRSAQRTLPDPVVSDRAIMGVARELLTTLRAARRVPARLVGVRLSSLKPDRNADQDVLFAALPARSGETQRDRVLTRAIDRVRGKFGLRSILPASLTEGEE
jgi:DNA polymerase-4